MEDKLQTVNVDENCIACFESTGTQVKCCKAPICKQCYLEWLKKRRQCMHCKADQCEFEDWVVNYRVDDESDLEDGPELDIEIVEITLDNTNQLLQELTEHTLINLSNRSIQELIDSVRSYNNLFQLYMDIQSNRN